MIKLSDYVFEFINRLNVKDVFLLSGGGCMHLVDSLGRNKKLNYICCLHEQVAAYAASAYAQYNKNIGVALVTTGPGGTNALTGVAAAWSDSIPLLVISGQVKRPDISSGTGLRTLGYQELDVVSMAKPVTRYAVTVTKPEKIKYHLEKAVSIAKSGRPGPVWIDIPLDVQAAKIDENNLESFTDEVEAKPRKNISAQVTELIKLINSSNRPVIIAGYGITISDSNKKFQELISELEIPVLTTWKALDLLPENHPLFLGRPGCIGQRGANFIQQNSDLIISIGARLDFGQIGYSHETFARNAKKVIVDIDNAELNKFKFKTNLLLNVCAGEFIDELLNQLENKKTVKKKEWLEHSHNLKNKYPVILDKFKEKKSNVSSYALVDTLNKLSSDKDMYVPENSGAASEVLMQAIKLKEGQRVITMNTLGAMGSGLPAALGACIASENKKTICVNGDGGFMMNIQDLETIARHNLPIKFFVLNNGGYGSIRNMQNNYFNGFYVASEKSSGVTIPEMEKVADSYKIDYEKITSNEELDEKVDKILASSKPVLCEVIVNPEEKTQPKLTSLVKPDGSMVSKPLEDLWPFLDREEFLENMVVEPLKED